MDWILDQVPDLSRLSNLNIPLQTLLIVAGVGLGLKWAAGKALGLVAGAFKKTGQAIVSVIPVNSVKVASGYAGAGVLGLASATALGYGISNSWSAPSAPSAPSADSMYKEALAKVKEGADPKAVEGLMKEWKEVAAKKYENEKAAYDAAVTNNPPKPGTPLIVGGVVGLVLSLFLGIRTNDVDTQRSI